MTHLGPLHFCLGIHIVSDASRGIISLHQSRYIETLLTRFHMNTSHAVSTPLPVNLKSQHEPSSSNASQSYPYAHVLGGIRYLVTCT
ncbi:hypothetical protein KP509_1Z149000 [Ceratopteris richardii]|nr:hypothetical protein KP509_1Z149000 [Ceratopteris richardii]